MPSYKIRNGAAGIVSSRPIFDVCRATARSAPVGDNFAEVSFAGYQCAIEMLDDRKQADLLWVNIVLKTGTRHGIAPAGMARLRRASLPVLFMTEHPEFIHEIPGGRSVLFKSVSTERLITAVAATLARSDCVPPGVSLLRSHAAVVPLPGTKRNSTAIFEIGAWQEHPKPRYAISDSPS